MSTLSVYKVVTSASVRRRKRLVPMYVNLMEDWVKAMMNYTDFKDAKSFKILVSPKLKAIAATELTGTAIELTSATDTATDAGEKSSWISRNWPLFIYILCFLLFVAIVVFAILRWRNRKNNNSNKKNAKDAAERAALLADHRGDATQGTGPAASGIDMSPQAGAVVGTLAGRPNEKSYEFGGASMEPIAEENQVEQPPGPDKSKPEPLELEKSQ